MFQARSEWRHIRLIFDHAEGLLIRFTYSFSRVRCGNYHNCCAKHAGLYVCSRDARVCHEMEIPVPNPINAGWMAGHAEEEGGYWCEGKRKGRVVGGIMVQHTANDSPGRSARPPGAPALSSGNVKKCFLKWLLYINYCIRNVTEWFYV